MMGFAKGYAHVKTTIIALSAVALIAAAPAELVQDGSGRTPGLQHEVVKKHHASGHVRPREMQTMGAGKGYSGALGYAPGERSGYLDRDLEVSGRQAGGGGGGAACEPSRSDHLTSSELQTGHGQGRRTLRRGTRGKDCGLREFAQRGWSVGGPGRNLPDLGSDTYQLSLAR